MKKLLLGISLVLSTSVFADYKITFGNSNGIVKVPEPEYLTGCIYDENNYWYYDSGYRIQHTNSSYPFTYRAYNKEYARKAYTSASQADDYAWRTYTTYYKNDKYLLYEGTRYYQIGTSMFGYKLDYSARDDDWNGNELELMIDGDLYLITQGERKVLKNDNSEPLLGNGKDVIGPRVEKEWELCFEKI